MLYLKQERGKLRIELSPDEIKALPLTEEWESVDGIVEKIGSNAHRVNRTVLRPSWSEIFVVGKLAEDEHVLLIYAKHTDVDQWERDSRWHMYVNGELVWRMTNEDGHAFSSIKINTQQAMHFADIYIRSDKMRFGIKFDREINTILQQYRKTHCAEN